MDNENKMPVEELNYIISLLHQYEQGEVSSTIQKALDEWVPDISDLELSFINEKKAKTARGEVKKQLFKYISYDIEKKKIKHLMWSRWGSQVAAVAMLFLVTTMCITFLNYKEWHISIASNDRKVWTTNDTLPATIKLSDGSHIELNAGSRLEITEKYFNKEKREVWLSGEAFFVVAKNPEKPFIIHTGDIKTIVRGTSFNVKAYAQLDENVVSVRDGKVEVVRGEEQLAMLTSNKQLRYNAVSHMSKTSDINWIDAAGWTQGCLVLNGVGPLELKMRLLQQYGISVSIEGNALDGKCLSGSFHHDKNIVEVMNTICALYNIHYEIKDNKMTITP